MPRVLNIDVETFSSEPIKKTGAYKYVASPDFEILLFAYSIDGLPVEVIDLTETFGELPKAIEDMIFDPAVEKRAYNAAFERAALAAHFKKPMPAEQWSCTMNLAAQVGLPFGLGSVADVLKLPIRKDMMGGSLIRYFAIPCKPTKANGMRTRNYPEHDMAKWEAFKSYCKDDVVVEMAVREKVQFFGPGADEKRIWCMDQAMNDYGVEIDPVLVQNAISIDNAFKEICLERAVKLTGLSNPNSGAQLKNWLSLEIDEEVSTLRKDAIPDMIKATDSAIVKEVLELRQLLSKSSIKKYAAMIASAGADNRIRGLLQYYGANRTGRWSGRLVQIQNLTKNKLKDIDLARDLVIENDADSLDLLFGNIPDSLSQLIRTAFVAGKGNKFVISDLSAIEARVISWLADEQWRMDVFKGDGRIYEATGAAMFHVPIEEVTDHNGLRSRAKVSELACGFGGGPNALIKMGALDMGIKEEILQELVDRWREANPNIVKLWARINYAVLTCMRENRMVTTVKGVQIFVKNGVLFIKLPGGRCLSYLRPELRPSKFGGDQFTYEGAEQTTGKWVRLSTYGGKLVENLCQAIARDVIAYQMLAVHDLGYKIVMSVHDEMVVQVPENDKQAMPTIVNIMSAEQPWAPGLPLGAKAYTSYYYKKD